MIGERDTSLVLTKVDDGVFTMTISRPEQLNAVTVGVLTGLADAVERADKDPAVKVIVVRGAGRAFSSGADIGGPDGLPADIAAERIDTANRLVAAIRDARKPVVAVVQGPCAGVGVSIALAADLTMASTEAYFLLAFTKVGLMPDGGASALVAAAVGRARAMRMGLLAERLCAQEAQAAGLIASVSVPEEFEGDVGAVLDALRHGASDALARTKQVVNAATLDGLESAFVSERAGQLVLIAAPDFEEGVAAFAERRRPAFTDPAM